MTLPSGCPALNDLEWWVLEVGAEVLKPLMLGMVTLEGQRYVTGSLVIPLVESIRKGLHAAGDRLEELGAAIGPQILPNGAEFHMESILLLGSREQSLRTLKSLKVLHTVISSDARRSLKLS